MGPTDFFIRRAVTTTLLMVAILGFGLLSYFTLPVSDLPNVEYPTIQVSAALPGANPDVMASSVATPLEKEFSNIAGVDSMSSSSSLGATTITLQFDMSRSIDAAAQDVQAAISRAGGELPTDMPSPPSYSKQNPAARPVLYMSLSSPTMTFSALDEYAETLIARRISMVSGVSQVQVYGAKKYAVRIQADPNKLAARDVGLEELRDTLAHGNINLPSGSLYGFTKAFTVQSNSQLGAASQFRPMIVRYQNGNPVRLEDLANVMDSETANRSVFWANGKLGMILAVGKQPGTNTVSVVEGIQKILPNLRQNMPAGIRLETEFDASQNIRDSIRDVKFTLLLTIVLVIFVIFFFLRNISATVIPSLAVPLSLLGTFAVMKLLGFTIDTLSMMAMTLSVGFVVDDAIVMLENIVRHMEMGKPRLQAAYEGAREVGFTIVSMTVSLIAVFIPVLFLQGIIGRLLREFSITIAVAVLVSGIISLTLTPMLCSRFLHHEEHHRSRFYHWSESFFQSINDTYRRTLLVALRFRRFTLVFSLAMAVATVYLFIAMPKSFLPVVDSGIIFGGTEASEDTSYDQMVILQKQVVDIVAKDPWITTWGGGTGGFSGQNQGFMFMHLKDDPHRPKASAVIAELSAKFAQIPGIVAFLQVPPLLTLGQNESRYQYSVALEDAETGKLYHWAPVLEQKLRSMPGIADVYSDLHLTSPRINVDIDRDRALALGVTPDQIANTLYDAYGNRRVSSITTSSNEYDVILEVLPEYQRDPSALSKLYIRSSSGKSIPLSAVTHLIQGVAPLAVNHIGQLPAVNFEFNLKPGVSLSEATKQVDEAARDIGLPDTMSFSYQGTAEVFQNSLKGFAILLVIAILVIYLVLGILYESFIHPITILSGLPSAGMGALITLLLFHEDLNLYSFVGIILLIGIVKKNAIMMIDFAIMAQRSGKSPQDAIFEGCIQRFRPIMMTTMAALLGTLPIAFGYGAGGEARRPLGLAVVGGLVVSQLLTLYITPVIYLYLERFTAKFTSARKRAGIESQTSGSDTPVPVSA
jgi:hydrophobe/amphiphile efflux-1 (HAE1) family protein